MVRFVANKPKQKQNKQFMQIQDLNLLLHKNHRIAILNLMAKPIQRLVASALEQYRLKYPVITLTGPRQSGKTTLCRMVFDSLPYENLEAPDISPGWSRSWNR